MFKINEFRKQIKQYKSHLKQDNNGLILFCFGTSFISRLIMVMTRENEEETVPSHVAIIYKNFIYESTNSSEKVGNKKIPSGVRRWLLKDFLMAEKKKDTSYELYPVTINEKELEKNIHLPYGVDTIVDYALKDGSDGVSKGLICSQYGNKVTGLIQKDCVTPAEMYRFVKGAI